MTKMKMNTSVIKHSDKMKMDSSVNKQKDTMVMQKMDMLPMPFFTHMGTLLDVGSFNLRVAYLPTIDEGKYASEFNLQLMTSASKHVGFLIGASGSFKKPTVEVMTQFLVWKSKNGMNGISPIIEFEFPLWKDAPKRVYTLVGFSTTASNSRIAFNQVLHYSPLESLVEGSLSLVIKVAKRIFLVSEVSGVFEKGVGPIINLVGGMKIKLNKNFMLGLGYQHSVTTNKDFSSQFIVQPDIDWKIKTRNKEAIKLKE